MAARAEQERQIIEEQRAAARAAEDQRRRWAAGRALYKQCTARLQGARGGAARSRLASTAARLTVGVNNCSPFACREEEERRRKVEEERRQREEQAQRERCVWGTGAVVVMWAAR